MTVTEKFESMLFEMGLFDSQASKILDMAIPKFAELVPDYNITWDRPANEYPDEIYNVGFALVIKPTALECIDKNCPQAWFRPMFL